MGILEGKLDVREGGLTWQIRESGLPSCEGCGCWFGERGSCDEAAEGASSGGGGAEERGRHCVIAVEDSKG